MLYILKTIVGIPRTCRSEALPGDMGMAARLLGFNADNLKKGLRKREDTNQYGERYKKIYYVTDLSPVLDNIRWYCKYSVIGTFNNSICRLRKMLLSGAYVLDSTIIEKRQIFPYTRRRKKKKGGCSSNLPDYHEYIYGLKLLVLYEVKSRMIVAIHIVPAHEDDRKYFLPVIRRGIHNCGMGRIKVVIADRGFLDGFQLWKLKHKINFIIPGKTDMIIRENAIGGAQGMWEKTVGGVDLRKRQMRGVWLRRTTVIF